MPDPIRVMIAEDSRADVLLVREALKAQSIEHELFVTADFAVAAKFLERVGKAPDAPIPDIFLLDLNLPKGDGFELLQKIKENPVTSAIPVIIFTSSDSPKDRSVAMALGANEYFCKPADFEEFVDLGVVIRRILSLE